MPMIDLPGELLVGVVQLPNGQRGVAAYVDKRLALRILATAMEDVRDQLYADKDTRILPPSPLHVVKP